MMPWTVSGKRCAVRALVEESHELLGVEGIAARPLEERRLDVGGDGGPLYEGVHELRGLRFRQRRERERQCVRLAAAPGPLAV